MHTVSTSNIDNEMLLMASSASSGSTDGADVPTTIKQEADDDIPQTVSFSDYLHEKLPQLADHNYCELKPDIHLGNIPPIVASSCHESHEFEADTLTWQSERDDACNISEPLYQGTEESELAPQCTENLYVLKDEFPRTPQTKRVHSDTLNCESVVYKD